MFARWPAALAMVIASLPLVAAAAKDVGQGERIVLTPAQGTVGTRFTVSCKDFPEPVSGTDYLYIVAAGTPEVDLNTPAGRDLKVLWKDYAWNCWKAGRSFLTAGPLAPGNYEIRFETSLYNNDKRGEIATRTAFTVADKRDEKIVMEPAPGGRFTLICQDFPQPFNGTDYVYIVAAGTPDVDLNTPAGRDIKVLWKDYAWNCWKNGRSLWKIGPFPPGAYEARFATSLYNNDKRAAIAARTAFTVR